MTDALGTNHFSKNLVDLRTGSSLDKDLLQKFDSPTSKVEKPMETGARSPPSAKLRKGDSWMMKSDESGSASAADAAAAPSLLRSGVKPVSFMAFFVGLPFMLAIAAAAYSQLNPQSLSEMFFGPPPPPPPMSSASLLLYVGVGLVITIVVASLLAKALHRQEID